MPELLGQQALYPQTVSKTKLGDKVSCQHRQLEEKHGISILDRRSILDRNNRVCGDPKNSKVTHKYSLQNSASLLENSRMEVGGVCPLQPWVIQAVCSKI